jgi:hypothetical protein
MKGFNLIAALLLSLITFGQEDIIIIDKSELREYKRQRPEREIRLNDNTKVIKFSPLSMMVGEINFGYERQLSIKGSIDLQFGPTISEIGFGNVDNHQFNQIGVSSRHNSGLGFLIGAGYRYYPLDETEALNRLYVSPVLKYRLYNYSIDELSGVLDPLDGSDQQLNFYFNFGYQLWVSNSFSLDFYTGMGIGYQEIFDGYATTIWNDQMQQNENVWITERSTGARYVFNMGLKVGIGYQ